ncbi:SERTA domain-containing protein 3 [Paecilomyces lecythidis]|uniref:SERTA domain-containing protein 3 n=1 Tax=Paecilomyces lecythidis TaxID=3004212 RepID=A0ABR3YB54_9EURO
MPANKRTFDGNPIPRDDDDMEDRYKSKNDLSNDQKQEIVEKIANLPTDDIPDFISALESEIAPSGFGLSSEDLLTIIKPYESDTNTTIQSQARKALRRVQSLQRDEKRIYDEEKRPAAERETIYANDSETSRNELSAEQKKHILINISNLTSDDPTEFLQSLETSIIPPGCALKLRDILAILHPDKWKAPELSELCNMADAAYKRVQHIVDQVETEAGSNVVKKNWTYHHRDPEDVPPAPAAQDHGGLTCYHIEQHQKATKHVQTIFSGVMLQEESKPLDMDRMKRAEKDLHSINELIWNHNSQNGYYASLGTIDHVQLAGHWRPALQTSERGRKESLKNLKRYCEISHYPQGWGQIPVTDKFKYKAKGNYWHNTWSILTPVLVSWYEKCLNGSSVRYEELQEGVKKFRKELETVNTYYQQQENSHIPDEILSVLDQLKQYSENRDRDGYNRICATVMQTIKDKGYPEDWAPPKLEGSHWSKAAVSNGPNNASLNNANSVASTNSNAVAVSGNYMTGQRQVMTVRPRIVQRRIEPGKTSTGEKILFVQKLGLNRANLVVVTSDGSYYLVDSASAGGPGVVTAAIDAGVPFVIRDEATIKSYRDMINSGGGTYGLWFVAPGSWDITKNRLPYIVVGFQYSGPNTEVKEAISRSNLGKITSPRGAERLIAEGILGQPNNMTLRNIFFELYMGAPITQSHLGLPTYPQTTKAIPQGQALPQVEGATGQRNSLTWGEHLPTEIPQYNVPAEQGHTLIPQPSQFQSQYQPQFQSQYQPQFQSQYQPQFQSQSQPQFQSQFSQQPLRPMKNVVQQPQFLQQLPPYMQQPILYKQPVIQPQDQGLQAPLFPTMPQSIAALNSDGEEM